MGGWVLGAQGRVRLHEVVGRRLGSWVGECRRLMEGGEARQVSQGIATGLQWWRGVRCGGCAVCVALCKRGVLDGLKASWMGGRGLARRRATSSAKPSLASLFANKNHHDQPNQMDSFFHNPVVLLRPRLTGTFSSPIGGKVHEKLGLAPTGPLRCGKGKRTVLFLLRPG